MIVGIRGHENQIQFNSIQFNSIVYIQVTIFKYLVIHALSPASMNSTSSFLPRDCISGWSRRRTTQRQDLGRGWPARKLITKKEGAGGGARRMGGKRGRHSELSAHSDCHIISIQETTQQGPPSSSNSKQSNTNQNAPKVSFIASQANPKKNSNIPVQRKTPQLCPYLASISAHMQTRQPLYIPKPIADPLTISEYNRSKLVGWMLELAGRFGFRAETGLLAVNIVDRGLGVLRVGVEGLPRLGVTALFMATKYEEIMIPHLNNFIGVVPAVYKVTLESVLRLQSNLLLLLNFDLGYCSPLLFINQYCLQRKIPQETKTQAETIVRKLLISSSCRYWPASQLASYAIRSAEQLMMPVSVQGQVSAQGEAQEEEKGKDYEIEGLIC